MPVKERLSEYLKVRKLSQSAFEKGVGLSNGYVNNIRKSISPDKLQSIALYDPKLNTGWLITGEGEMFKSEGASPVNTLPKGIAYYSDIDVTAGADDLFTDGSHAASRYIFIPEFEDCDNAFPLYGDSMYPKYQSGQVILCKEFKEWRDFVPFGEVFLVITDSLRMVKYVKKASTDEHYLLASENSHFESFEVPKNRIRRMFLVKGAIQRNMI